MGLFCVSTSHFHTVFNTTVENFHQVFIKAGAFPRRLARELLSRRQRKSVPKRIKILNFSVELSRGSFSRTASLRPAVLSFFPA
jgi:hypothetical protein